MYIVSGIVFKNSVFFENFFCSKYQLLVSLTTNKWSIPYIEPPTFSLVDDHSTT